MTALRKRFLGQAHIYNVVVTRNPWYVPHMLVRSKLRDFVPQEAHHQILIEWGRKFQDDYGLVADDIPSVFLLDENGMVIWRHKGKMRTELLDTLEQLLEAIKPVSG